MFKPGRPGWGPVRGHDREVADIKNGSFSGIIPTPKNINCQKEKALPLICLSVTNHLAS